MHASIRRYKVPKGSIDEVVRRVDTNYLPALAKKRAFIGYFVVDVGHEELVTITLFGDEFGTKDATEFSAEWVKEHLHEFNVKREENFEGKVVVHGGE